MPLLEIVQTRQVNASIRLTDTTANQVDQYAHFAGAGCADEVVEEALKHVFTKDREFQDFLKTPAARQVTASLRIRKAPATEASEALPKKLAAPAQSAPQTAAAAGSKA